MKYGFLILILLTLGACATSPQRDGETPCACLDQQYFQGKLYEINNV